MVAEAKAVRQRMLRDFAERRRTARQQLEAARVAREGIVEAIRTATVRLDDALGELDDSEAVVRRASDEAADAVLDDVDRVVAEIEAELERGVAAEEVDGPDGGGAGVAVDRGRRRRGGRHRPAGGHDGRRRRRAPGPAATCPRSGPDHGCPGRLPGRGGCRGRRRRGRGGAGEPVAGPAAIPGRTGEGEGGRGSARGQRERCRGRGQMASVHDLFERLRSAEPAGVAGATATGPVPRAPSRRRDRCRRRGGRRGGRRRCRTVDDRPDRRGVGAAACRDRTSPRSNLPRPNLPPPSPSGAPTLIRACWTAAMSCWPLPSGCSPAT